MTCKFCDSKKNLMTAQSEGTKKKRVMKKTNICGGCGYKLLEAFLAGQKILNNTRKEDK